MENEDPSGKTLEIDPTLICGSTVALNTTIGKSNCNQDCFEFEKLIAGFSSTIISMPSKDLRHGLGPWLERIAACLDIDQLIVKEFIDDRTDTHILHQFTATGYASEHVNIKTNNLTRLMHRSLQNGPLIVNRIPDDFPPEVDYRLIKAVQADGVKCILILPLGVEKNVIGSITFASYRKTDLWINSLVQRLFLIAEIISNALARKESDQKLTQYQRNLEQVLEENNNTLRALQESEERFRSIFHGAMDGIILSDTSSRQIVMANRAMCRMMGYTTKEIVALHIDDIHPPEALAKSVLPFLTIKKERPFPQGFDIPVKKKDGTIFHADISNSLLHLNNRSFYIGVFRDVSERKMAEAEKDNLQKQLVQSQKMEAVGMLAGGVAHDFNNMLSVVLGYTELQMLDHAHDSDTFTSLKSIHDAAERSAGLVRQLLAFARKQTIEPKVLDFNRAIAAILDMLRHLIGEHIQLNFVPDPGTGNIRIDPAQIDQIMANLIVNARDAISDIGEVTIRTELVVFGKSHCIAHPGCTPGTYAQLTVSDSGCGMDRATLEKIFEPFFTTKGLGEGTGLGLATVYGIVKQNNGYIYASSEVNKGTSFKILFPSVDNTQAEHSPAVCRGMTIPMGKYKETILIVEDDGIMLNLVKTLLEKLNYSVLCAGLPRKALELARSHVGEIDLLLTDVVLPQMNGKELTKQLTAIRPNIKCLYMSGYPSNVISNRAILERGVYFIKKPFTLKHLADKVHQVLNSSV